MGLSVLLELIKLCAKTLASWNFDNLGVAQTKCANTLHCMYKQGQQQPGQIVCDRLDRFCSPPLHHTSCDVVAGLLGIRCKNR